LLLNKEKVAFYAVQKNEAQLRQKLFEKERWMPNLRHQTLVDQLFSQFDRTFYK
jgi:hypothetical protein